MKGSLQFRGNREGGYWRIAWYNEQAHKLVFISRNTDGSRMETRRQAEKLLAWMQRRVEDGTFRLDEFTKQRWSEVADYLWTWFGLVENELAPNTRRQYRSTIKCHLEPYFTAHRIRLHEVRHDTLKELLNGITAPSARFMARNVIAAMLKFAWKSQRIPAVPPIPAAKQPKHTPTWLPEERQLAVFDAMPAEHRPIFLWLKYHLRRPSEACALKWEHWHQEEGVFVLNGTKTGDAVVPCHGAFRPVIDGMRRSLCPHFFNTAGRPYTLGKLTRIKDAACAKCGEDVTLYELVKHSSCGQLVNEYGLSISQLQDAGGWADIESVRHYAKVEINRRRELLEGKVIRMPERKAE